MEMERLKVEQLRQSSMSPHEKLIQETTLIQSLNQWNLLTKKQEIKTATEFDINEVWKITKKTKYEKLQ